MLSKVHQKLASWVALWAVFFAALAPVASHAVAAESAPLTLWQEICTAQGTKFVSSVLTLSSEQSASEDSRSMQPHVGALEHCPFCNNQSTAVSVPPDNHVLFLAALNATDRPDVYQAPLVQTYYQSAHLSRAPPSP
jgi:predicted acyl esterase